MERVAPRMDLAFHGEASDNLPDPDVIAAEIVEDLRAALEQFEAVMADLPAGKFDGGSAEG